MNPSEFATKWRGVTTGERASAQSHFGDLCRMLGEPTPTDADPTGSWYAFETGAVELLGPLLDRVPGAGRVGIGRGRLTEHPAEVTEMGLGRGTFAGRHAAPLRGELGGSHAS